MDWAAGSDHSSSVERLGAAVRVHMALLVRWSHHFLLRFGGRGVQSKKTEGIPAVRVCDSPVEFRLFEKMLRCGLGSLEICSTKNTSESTESIEVLVAIKNKIE